MFPHGRSNAYNPKVIMLAVTSLAILCSPIQGNLPCDFSAVPGPSVFVPNGDNAEPFAFDGSRLVSAHQGSVSARVDVREFDALTRQWVYASTFLVTANRYAESLDIDGDVMVIGRAGPSVGAGDQSAEVRVLDASSNEWNVEALLRPPVLQPGAELGLNVEVSGDTIMMEHHELDIAGVPNAGAIEVFERGTSGAWLYAGQLTAPTPSHNGRFGFSMDLDGDRLIVGEPRAQTGSGVSGRVHLFERDLSGLWQWVSTLEHPQTPGTNGGGFGQAVALDGDIAAVTTLSEYPAAVQLLDRDLTGWSHGERVGLGVGLTAGIFTSSVDISGDTLAVGWRNNVGGNLTLSGVRATLFERESGSWSSPRHYLRPTYTPSSLERYTAMISEHGVVALGWRRSNGTGGVDQIDRFDANGNGQPDACEGIGLPVCPGALNSTGAAGELLAVGSSALPLNDLVLAASEMPTQTFALALSSSGTGSTPVGAGTLCLAVDGSLGRHVTQVMSTGATGSCEVPVDLENIPSASGLATVTPGSTWYFQAWFRDSGTSNLTSAVSVTFD